MTELRYEKLGPASCPYTNEKCTVWSLPLSGVLISNFNSELRPFAKNKILLFLIVSVTKQTGLKLIWSKILKTMFSRQVAQSIDYDEIIITHVTCIPGREKNDVIACKQQRHRPACASWHDAQAGMCPLLIAFCKVHMLNLLNLSILNSS